GQPQLPVVEAEGVAGAGHRGHPRQREPAVAVGPHGVLAAVDPEGDLPGRRGPDPVAVVGAGGGGDAHRASPRPPARTSSATGQSSSSADSASWPPSTSAPPSRSRQRPGGREIQDSPQPPRWARPWARRVTTVTASIGPSPLARPKARSEERRVGKEGRGRGGAGG